MRTIILFILVIFSFQTFGQKLKYRIEHLGAENGLSQGSVYSMYKDSNGNMWFGTMDGLNFWNGKTMKVYRPSKKDPFSIDGIDIKKIIGYKVNGLLVGTENSLNIFDSETEQFKKVYFRDQNGKITQNEVFPISVSGEELKLWLGGVGLINYNFNTKKQQILVLEKSFKTNYFSNVNTTQNDAGQNIWIHGDQGLMKYSLKTKKIAYFFSKNKNNLVGKNEEIVKIHIQKDNIWIGTFDGFIRFNTKTLGIKKWMFFDQKKPIGVVFDLSTDKDGNLWLGTEKNGLLFFDTQNETFEQLSNKGSFSNSKLHNDEISHVYVDNDGIVWVNTDPYGVDKIQILPGNFGTYKLNLEGKLPESMQNFSIRSVLKDKNTLWLGTQQSGVWRVNANNFSIIDGFYNLNSKIIPSNTIRYIHKDKSGTIWLGTSEGLAYYDKNRFKPVSDPESKMANKFIRVLEEFKDELWIGTENGIFRLNKKNKKTAICNLLSDRRISLIKFISDTKVLVGVYNEGLFEAQSADNFKTFTVKNLINSGIPTSLLKLNDKIWVGTSNGLLEYNPKTGTKKWIKREDGLPNEFIYSIEIDDEKQLWLSTNKGIVKLDPKTSKIHSFSMNDGLQGFEFNGYCSFKDSTTGKMFFGGINGLNHFNPKEISIVGKKNTNVLTDEISQLRPNQISYFLDTEQLFSKPLPNNSTFDSKFQIFKGKTPNFSYTPYQVWTRFTFKNKTNKAWFLEVGNSRLSEMEVWLYERNQLILYKKSGDKIPIFKYDVRSPNPIFKLDMIENQDYEIFIKASGTRDLKFPIMFWEENELLEQLSTNKLIWGIYMGFIILISLYNIFLWITIKEVVYIYYSIYILLFGAFQLSLYGFGFQYIWSNSWFNEIAYFVFLFISNIFLIQFTDSFLDLSKNYKTNWQRIKNSLIFGSLITTAISFFYFRYWFNYLAIGQGVLFSAIFMLITVDYILKKRVIIYYYGLATFFLVIATLIVGLQNLALIEPLYQEKIIMAGSMLEIILFSVALGYKYRQNQLEKERQQMLRNQISGNLHDDLAASLSSLTMYAELSKRKLDSPNIELQERFERISQKSREILGKVREAVYELNPKNDSEEEWLERIVNFGKDIFETKNIEFRALIAEGFDSKSIIPAYRRDVFLIFKEAMNNAAKYSEADTITFEIRKSTEGIMLFLKDNGIGIEPSKMDVSNGISNMKARAKKINGTLEINSAVGTEIILKLPNY